VLKEWLTEQPFTLTMSSGFFSFFAHCGMLSVLEKERLIPEKISGSSAGAMIGACWASGCPTGLIKEKLFTVSKSDFWDPALGFGLLKGDLLRQLIESIVFADRLEDCPIPVAVSVFDLLSRTTHILTSGSLPEVVHASCAVPFLFHPIRINGRYYLDGGVKDRHGLAGVENGSRIFYHHISTRSPWRRRNSPSLQIPDWTNMASLVIDNLPRVGPNRLDQGKLAYEKGRRGMELALQKPLWDNRVFVSS